jgi:hypothetical protein
MKSLLKKAVLGASLAATTLAVATPAEAQRYRYDRYRHHNNGGAAVAAGIAGLAIGAALASSNDPYRNRWYSDRGYRYDYDNYYYRQRGYYPTDGYYAYRYSNYANCWTERRYDPYYGRRVKIRVCN